MRNILKFSLPAAFLAAAATLSGCNPVVDTPLKTIPTPACVEADQADAKKVDDLYTRFEEVTGSKILREESPSFSAEVLKFGDVNGAFDQVMEILDGLSSISQSQLKKFESGEVGGCHFEKTNIRADVLADLIVKYSAKQTMLTAPPQGELQQDDGLWHDGPQSVFPNMNAPKKLHI